MNVSERNTALDVLRGITVAGMILVNNPGGHNIFAPLKHAAWTGCTPTDLVFPFFLLCNGMAMAFSYARRGSTLNCANVLHILRRGLLLFLTGLVINMIPLSWHGFEYWLGHIRIMGILQRIALSYIVGGILALWIRKPGRIAAAIALLTAAHWMILRLGGQFPGWDTPEGNIGRAIDIAVFGEDHLYHGFGTAFDPEGLLGTISGSATFLLGYAVGVLLHQGSDNTSTTVQIFALSAVCLALGTLWSGVLPICKALWTGSYVLVTGGWALYVFAFLSYVIAKSERSRVRCVFEPFIALGRNPLLIFVAASLVARIPAIRSLARAETCAGALVYPLCLILFFTLVAMWMKRKNISVRF